jgi:YgiT-type zinc finger domain-containing protein
VKCIICRTGKAHPGATTITLERGVTTLVIKAVPAQICDNCGEAYVDEEVTKTLLGLAESAVDAGVQLEVREFNSQPA